MMIPLRLFFYFFNKRASGLENRHSTFETFYGFGPQPPRVRIFRVILLFCLLRVFILYSLEIKIEIYLTMFQQNERLNDSPARGSPT
jgi:hypothetical protein